MHGDIKPSNVFLDNRGAAFLGDFGIRDFLPGDMRGHTLEYAAPELLEGQPRSVATDTWATGVTVYELLTGELPFGSRVDDAEDAITARIARAQYPHPDSIRPPIPPPPSPEFLSVLLRPRSSDAEDHYSGWDASRAFGPGDSRRVDSMGAT